MHTKLAGTMCNAPSGMYTVSGSSLSFDSYSHGKRQADHGTKYEPPPVIKCMLLTNRIICKTEL